MAKSEQLRVGIIMGSDSDMSTMQYAGAALRDAGLEPTVGYESRVVSAHRTPEWMTQYAHEAEERGLQVIIPGAGGSAHLPGMVASETVLPVAGVAVTSHPEVMNRALGSLIGMPEGKPLATFQAQRGAYEAGVFAARILAVDSDSNRVGIVASSEMENEIMHHVGRALGVLGLAEATDYQYLTAEDLERAYQSSNWARDNGLAVVVGNTTKSMPESIQDLTRITEVPVMGVAITENPDTMSPALESLVNPVGHDPVAAFQGPAGAFNAGLKAARILALKNPDLRQKIVDYSEGLKTTNVAKDAIMNRLGDVAYAGLSKDELQELIRAEINVAEPKDGTL